MGGRLLLKIRYSIDSGWRLNSFNALRLILALIVLIGHSFSISGNQFNFSIAEIPLTSLSVYCFFILSGYLITPGLVNGGGFNYIVRRIARIYPAYIGVIIIVGFGFSSLWQKMAPVKSFNLFDQIRYVFFNLLPPPGLFNQESKMVDFLGGQPTSVPRDGVPNGSLWSLTLEFLAYLALFLLFISSRKFGKSFKLILFWIFFATYIWAIIGSICLGKYSIDNPTIFQSILLKWPYLLGFCSGALLSMIKEKKLNSNFTSFFAFTLFLVSTTRPFFFALFGVFALTIFIVNLGKSKTFTYFPLGIDISYGVYLYHFPVEQSLAHFIQIRQNFVVFVSFSIVATCLLAFVSARFIEGPSQRMAKTWLTKRQLGK